MTAPPRRPRVVVSATATIDGRVTLRRSSLLLDPEVQQIWRSLHPPGAERLSEQRHAWLEQTHGLRVVLEGSGTFVTESAPAATLPATLPATDLETAVLYEDFLPPGPADRRWFVVVDGRGRMRWTFRGDDEVQLLVLVCGRTPAAYLAFLRREQIPYLVVGEDRVDLGTALVSIHTQLDAHTVVSEAGGGLNGALLRAGLVDEIHLLLLPAVVGGRDTPTVFDGPPLGELDLPTGLRLVRLRSSDDGAVWLHYEVSGGGTQPSKVDASRSSSRSRT